MKNTTLTLTGSQKYWSNLDLVRIVERRTGWDEKKIKSFLAQNPCINFNQQPPDEIKRILDELDSAGFQVDLTESKDGGLTASIEVPEENVLNDIKAQLKEIREEPLYAVQEQLRKISEKVDRLESRQNAKMSGKTFKESPLYRQLTAAEVAEAPRTAARPHVEVRKPDAVFQATPSPAPEKRATTEANIGKYWLSKIGIFTLLLGIVFLITYTSQFTGAWGKLGFGLLTGVVLAGLGNFLSRKEQYYRWAMSAIGGGWAILYFTAFAAYHVPMVKVIANPFLGFLLMLAVAACFIGQSLQFHSRVLAFMAYFLAYFATVSTDVTFYTLVASYLLAVSAIFVTRKLGWSWLALLCLFAVYGIHWFWLEPSIYAAPAHFTSQDRLAEMLVAPWIGNRWQVYPMIEQTKSYLHLSFLTLYWVLFTVMGLFRRKEEPQGALLTTIALINGLIFVLSFMNHLHIYYPHLKWVFAMGMGGVFLGLSVLESKAKQTVLSDIYLVFSVSLFCLIIPMYFDGTSITYGWSGAGAGLIWLGLQHHRMVLRVVGWLAAGAVLLRLLCFDYLERTVLFQWILPVYPFFFVALFAGAAFALIYYCYDRAKDLKEEERVFGFGASVIGFALAVGSAFLMGGLRAIASSLFVLTAAGLLYVSVKKEQPFMRWTALVFSLLASLRFVLRDRTYDFSAFFSDPAILLRCSGMLVSVALLFVLGEWLRRQQQSKNIDVGYFHYFAVSAAVLFMILVADPATKSLLTLIWGVAAFLLLIFGFMQKERMYRWIGLVMFGLVLGRLFVYDFAQLQVLPRIISFIGLGLVFVVASFLYNYYSKVLLGDSEA